MSEESIVKQNKIQSDDELRIRLVQIFLGIVVFVVHSAHVGQVYTLHMSADELGYWGNAARFAGYDWSEVLKHLPYYGPGYGMLVFPLMVLIKDAVVLYRAAVILNAVLMVMSYVLMLSISRRIFTGLSPVMRAGIACVCALYSGYIAQSSIAWTECLLAFLFWLLVWIVSWMREGPAAAVLCMIAVTAYSYLVHQRTVCVVVAAAVTILYVLLSQKRSGINTRLCIVIAAAVCISVFIVILATRKMFAGTGIGMLRSENSYGGLISELLDDGFFQAATAIVCSVIGQLFYHGASTFLISLFSLCAMTGMLFGRLRKSRCIKPEIIIFILLSFFGMILETAVKMRYPWNRIDQFVYGRYAETMSVPILMFGLCFRTQGIKFEKIGGRIPGEIIPAALFILCELVTVYRIKYASGPHPWYQGSCAAGIYALDGLFEHGFLYCAGAFIVTGVSGYLLWLVMTNVNGEIADHAGRVSAAVRYMCFLAVLAVFFIRNGNSVFDNITGPYQVQNALYMNNKPDLTSIEHDRIVYFADTVPSRNFSSIIQMADRDEHIVIYGGDQWEEWNSSTKNRDIVYVQAGMEVPFGYLYDYALIYADTRFTIYSLWSQNDHNAWRIPARQSQLLNAKIEGDTIVTDGKEGYGFYGQYFDLKWGLYNIRFRGTITGMKEDNDILGVFDVAADVGERILGTRQISVNDVDRDTSEIDIVIPVIIWDSKEGFNIEARFYEYEGTVFRMSELSVETVR